MLIINNTVHIHVTNRCAAGMATTAIISHAVTQNYSALHI